MNRSHAGLLRLPLSTQENSPLARSTSDITFMDHRGASEYSSTMQENVCTSVRYIHINTLAIPISNAIPSEAIHEVLYPFDLAAVEGAVEDEADAAEARVDETVARRLAVDCDAPITVDPLETSSGEAELLALTANLPENQSATHPLNDLINSRTPLQCPFNPTHTDISLHLISNPRRKDTHPAWTCAKCTGLLQISFVCPKLVIHILPLITPPPVPFPKSTGESRYHAIGGGLPWK